MSVQEVEVRKQKRKILMKTVATYTITTAITNKNPNITLLCMNRHTKGAISVLGVTNRTTMMPKASGAPGSFAAWYAAQQNQPNLDGKETIESRRSRSTKHAYKQCLRFADSYAVIF